MDGQPSPLSRQYRKAARCITVVKENISDDDMHSIVHYEFTNIVVGLLSSLDISGETRLV